LFRGDRPDDLAVWALDLSDAPSRQWRRVFKEAAETSRAVSGHSALIRGERGERIEFDASSSILQHRVGLIDDWIKRANDATENERN